MFLCLSLSVLLFTISGCNSPQIINNADTGQHFVDFFAETVPDTIDIGEIKEGDIELITFDVRNCSKDQELLIKNIKSGCGCTTAEWEHTPIKGGENKEITIIYNSSGQFGKQFKTITVTSVNGDEKEIFLTTDVKY